MAQPGIGIHSVICKPNMESNKWKYCFLNGENSVLDTDHAHDAIGYGPAIHAMRLAQHRDSSLRHR